MSGIHRRHQCGSSGRAVRAEGRHWGVCGKGSGGAASTTAYSRRAECGDACGEGAGQPGLQRIAAHGLPGRGDRGGGSAEGATREAWGPTGKDRGPAEEDRGPAGEDWGPAGKERHRRECTGSSALCCAGFGCGGERQLLKSAVLGRPCCCNRRAGRGSQAEGCRERIALAVQPRGRHTRHS